MTGLPPVDYDKAQHRVYAKARAVGAETMARWMARFAAELPAARPLTILDLGSGTGRFSPALAETFAGPVWGVEPSEKMRAQAEAGAAHPAVRYLAGTAGAIPLPEASVDAVLMFLSFHHCPDKPAAAREVARVLRPGGRVLMRGEFGDRPPGVWWAPYFPRFETVARALFPSLDETLAAFADAGLHHLALHEVQEQYAASEDEAVERLKLRGISVFDHLDDAEIEAGFVALDADRAAGRLRVALSGRSDLLVLG